MTHSTSKRFASIFISLLLTPAFASAESLKEIYEQAVKNDHEYQAAIAEHAAGLETEKIGRAALLPSISASVAYSTYDGDATGLPGSITVGNTDFATTGDSKTDSWENAANITLTQPLFNLEAWYGYKGSKLATNAANTAFAGAEQALIIRTAQAYFEVLRAYDNLETAKAEEDAVAHQLEQTKQRFAVGLTAITEVHEAQAVYDSSTANRLIADGNLAIAFEALEVLTGQPYSKLAPLKSGFSVQAPTPKARTDWEKFALENNIELRLQALALKEKAYNVKIKKSAYAPTLTGQIGYNDSKSGGTSAIELSPNGSGWPESSLDNTSAGANARVTLNIPLFTGGRTTASFRQAKQELLKAEAEKSKTQRSVVQQTRSHYLNVMTSVATVKARKQAITSSNSALEATQAGYEVGTRDLVDVLNAQRSLYRAETEYNNALYTYIIYTLNLKQAAGILQASDITALDAWLDAQRQVGS